MKTEKENRYLGLINQNKGLVLKVCSMYAHNRDDFRDLQQEILYQIWKAMDTFRGESGQTTWMYRIALNCALMNLRKSSRQPQSTPMELLPGGWIEDTESAYGEEDFRHLHAAIRQLPEIDRAIILLYLEEQSQEEISRITGLKPNNIGVRILRIKQRLRTLLENQGYEPANYENNEY